MKRRADHELVWMMWVTALGVSATLLNAHYWTGDGWSLDADDAKVFAYLEQAIAEKSLVEQSMAGNCVAMLMNRASVECPCFRANEASHNSLW